MPPSPQRSLEQENPTRLFERAQRGDADAMLELARRYLRGVDLPADRAEGARWLIRAAEAGHPLGQFNLGVMYEHGFAVPERDFRIEADPARAAQWYARAAEAGNPTAQHNLAMLYRLGTGVGRDSKRAVALFQLAARQGLTASMLNLAEMLQAGEGTSRDPIEALSWLRVALDLEQRQGGTASAILKRVRERMAGLEPTLAEAERRQAERRAVVLQQELAAQPGRSPSISALPSDRAVDPGAARPAAEPTPPPTTAAAPTPSAATGGWPTTRAEQIRAVQALLQRLALYAGEVDGKNGPGTRNAVRAFEKQAGMTETGEVSIELYAALRQRSEASQALQSVPAASKPVPATPAIATPAATSDDWPQVRSDQFALVQRLLQQLGFYAGEIDGKNGPVIKAAIREFEKRVGLPETGMVTPELYAALRRHAPADGKPAALPQPPAAAAPQPAAAAAPQVTGEWPATRAERFTVVQTLLKRLGLYTGEIDGKNGPMIKAAIRAFEQQAGMEETGELSAELHAALQRRTAAAPAARGRPAEPPRGAAGEVWPQDRELQIGRTQQLLRSLGYYSGGIDSQLGKATRAAITAFQQDSGMAQTGTPSAELYEALARKVAEQRRSH